MEKVCGERVCSGEWIPIGERGPTEWATGVAERSVLLPGSDLVGKRRWEPFLPTRSDRRTATRAGARTA